MRTFAGLLCLTALLAACGDKDDDGEGTIINSKPVANAGADITQSADETVSLDGGGSYDPDGDPITYYWTFDSVPEGSSLPEREAPFTTNHADTSSTTFRPDASGTYVVKLVVKDGKTESDADYVVVTVEAGEIPVAHAGDDQEGAENETFTMDGTASYDPLGRDVSYEWSFASVPSASSLTALDNPTTSAPTFTADAGGVYIIALVVSNGISTSSPDTAVVRVSSADPLPPVAMAGEDITDAEDCTSITLDGSDSYDPNGDDLSYQWDIQSVPDGSSTTNADIADRTAVVTSFYPDIAGEYVVSLSVYDGSEWGTPDTVSVTASERSYNSAPTVDAGADQAIDGGEASCEESGYTYDCDECDSVTMTLGADASVIDADGDPYTVTWEVTSGSATINDSGSLSTTVTLAEAAPTEPGECEENEYVFTLSVIDCTGETMTDTVTYTLSCCGVEDTGSRRKK